ncbi:hypothetical protein RD792_009267 [Penstemon davidsonii]|uniref:Agenet domain-containing protein n=1 Tax=Penstemon davidsonii TaxID=160366 RepID=A0ABR0CZZ7_9LAMI|nr:hypothetical protein RD792_009267 [Penstemon davidsonii]
MDGASTQLQHLKPHQRGPISSPHHHHHYYQRRRKSQLHFTKGSLVEVQTDEEEFKGVYFLATVIFSSSPIPKNKGTKKKSQKLYVEYHNLLAREDSLALLREYVDISFVRPAPPPQELVTGFEPNDVVDAFYKDGWWTGVVKKPVLYEGGEKRFIVTFQYPPDELEFGIAELRVHWDWVNRSWFRPEKQSVAASMFDVGRKAEVSFDGEDCLDAWFLATIHADLGNGAFLVESSIGNEEQSHKVTVDSLHIRPRPPPLKPKTFVLLEKVDANVDSGWWCGVITKELEGNKYNVYFKHRKLEKEFHESELRPHMEWKDGKWFTSQDVMIPPSEDVKHENYTPENVNHKEVAVPVNNPRDRKDTDVNSLSSLNSRKDHLLKSDPVNQKPSHVTTYLTKRRQSLSDTQAAVSKPLKKQKEGDIVGASEQGTHDGSINEMLNGSRSPVPVNIMTGSVTQTATADQYSADPSWGKKIRSQRKVVTTQNGGDKVNSKSSSVKKSTQILQDENTQVDVGDAVRIIADENENAIKENELLFIIGLPCTEMGCPEVERSRDKRGHPSNCMENVKLVTGTKQQLNDSAIQILKDSKPSAVAEEFNVKRKRGRPRKNPIASPQTPLTGNVENGDVSDALSIQNSDPLIAYKTKLANGKSNPRNKKGSKRKRTLANKKVVRQSIRVQQKHSSNKGSRQITVEKFAPEVEGKSLASIMEQCRISSQNLQSDVIQLVEDNEKQPEALEQPSALIVKDSVEPSEKQGLPFVKNTSLWKTIESMEVFKKIPQKPHFEPLKSFTETSREGLAIGYMVTYSSIVEKASKLQLSDAEGIPSEILEIVADLERHGFDVSFIRDRITRYLAVKGKQRKLVDEANELQSQILVQNSDKSRIEEEIREINEQMQKFKEKLSLAELAKEMKDSEIDVLQAKLLETEESIKNLKLEFGEAASSMLL